MPHAHDLHLYIRGLTSPFVTHIRKLLISFFKGLYIHIYGYRYRYRYRNIAWIPKFLETHNSTQIYTNCLYYLCVCVYVCAHLRLGHTSISLQKEWLWIFAKPISNEMTWGRSISFSLILFATLEV